MKLLRTFVISIFILTLGAFLYYNFAVLSKLDKISPVISMDTSEISVSVSATDEDLLAGMTASDDRDGDVTDSLIVESHSKFSKPGVRTITYAAFDQAGNVGTASRTITYSDYTSPHSSLEEPLRFAASDYNYTFDGMIKAEDCIDGDITKLIKYKFGEDSSYGSEGDQLVSFQVTNSAGDTAVLELYQENLSDDDYVKPYPVLDQYLVYSKVGEKIATKSHCIGVTNRYNETLFEDEDEEDPRYTLDNIFVKSNVDINTPGTYRIIFTLKSDEDGKGVSTQGSVSLYVVVEE